MAIAHEKLRELREKQRVIAEQARSHLDAVVETATAEARTEGEAAFDRAMADYDRIGETIAREEKLMEREAARAEAEECANPRDPRRPTGEDREAVVDQADPKAAYRAAFQSYIRYGKDELTAEERKLLGPMRTMDDGKGGREGRAQGVVDSTAGGYLVPQGFQDELVVSMKAYGPMLDPGVTRELVTTTGNLIPWPSMNDTANQGRRLTENTQVETASLAFGVHQLFAYKYTTDVVLVANELLQDAAVDPEQIVRDAMAIRMGRVVNLDLTTGTGASMPTGIEFAAGNSYSAASATAIAFDDMIETEHSLDPDYRKLPGVKWMFHDLTLKALRKLKDGEGQYIWQPASVIAKAPATILGYDYAINQAMPQIGANNTSVVFGDMQRYVVRRVKEFQLRRLNERYADYDQVGFIGFGRYDGALVDSVGVMSLVHP